MDFVHVDSCRVVREFGSQWLIPLAFFLNARDKVRNYSNYYKELKNGRLYENS